MLGPKHAVTSNYIIFMQKIIKCKIWNGGSLYSTILDIWYDDINDLVLLFAHKK